MQMYKDIVFLLVQKCPRVANGFIRASKKSKGWILNDDRLMKNLIGHYQFKMHEDLNRQIIRAFHLSNKDRIISNITLNENSTAAIISFVPENKVVYTAWTADSVTKAVGQIQTQNQSKQSIEAMKEVRRIQKCYQSLPKSEFVFSELDTQVKDVISGFQWVCQQKAKEKRRWTLITFLMYFLLFEVFYILASSEAGRRKNIFRFLGWIFVFCVFVESGCVERFR
jgi:hypothetical protein